MVSYYYDTSTNGQFYYDTQPMVIFTMIPQPLVRFFLLIKFFLAILGHKTQQKKATN